MKLLNVIGCTALSLAAALPINAKIIMIDDVPVEIGKIIVNGSGCPSGTVEATASSDNTKITLLFSQYNAITTSDSTVALSDCNIAIPISVEPGYSVGIVEIDWRGSVYTTNFTEVAFFREFFFSGNQGPVHTTRWTNSGIETFNISDDPGFIHYSDCAGKPLIARADTNAAVVGPNSFFSLRSADVSARLLLGIDVKEC